MVAPDLGWQISAAVATKSAAKPQPVSFLATLLVVLLASPGNRRLHRNPNPTARERVVLVAPSDLTRYIRASRYQGASRRGPEGPSRYWRKPWVSRIIAIRCPQSSNNPSSPSWGRNVAIRSE